VNGRDGVLAPDGSIVPSTSQFNSWGCVASNTTGTNLVAGAAFGDVWTSSDSGATWTDRTPSGPAHDLSWASVASDSTEKTAWVSVASDSTGLHHLAATRLYGQTGDYHTGDIWTSDDAAHVAYGMDAANRRLSRIHLITG